LEADREDRDRFDRPLRYVWTADGRMTNRSLVASGHARAVLFQPNDRYWDLLRQVEADARDGALGLWACPQR
jgi:micrococcal nuclease